MLLFDRTVPDGASPPRVVAVLLHGRGSHRGDLQALAPQLPADWAVLTPQAPFQGHVWGYGPGWAWYRHLHRDRLDDDALRRSLSALDAFMAEVPHIVGGTPQAVIVGGFSQGGTVSMAYALTRPGAVAAALNLSGFLADSPAAPLPPAAPAPPIFWAHGRRDRAVAFDLAVEGRARLRELGVPLEERDYDIGHWVDPGEVQDAVAFAEGWLA